MTKLFKILTVILALGIAGVTFADTVSYTGNTETSADGSWMRPDATFSMVDTNTVLYSVQTFTVTESGLYDIESIQGEDTLGQQYDGFIFLYENSFDANDPITNGIAGDDDGVDGPGSSSMLGLSLSAGTTYYLVTSSFSPEVTSFGSGSGPFTNTISGPGDVLLDGSPVPLPAAFWLMLSGIAGLRAMRRS